MLDEIRYGVALLTLLTFPWALVVWYLVHPFVDFWRRVGPKLTYSALIGLGVAMGWVLWQGREPLLAVEYGTHPVLWVLAIPVGAVIKLEFIWLLADKLNAMMAIPNLIGLLILGPMVFRLTREYWRAKK